MTKLNDNTDYTFTFKGKCPPQNRNNNCPVYDLDEDTNKYVAYKATNGTRDDPLTPADGRDFDGCRYASTWDDDREIYYPELITKDAPRNFEIENVDNGCEYTVNLNKDVINQYKDRRGFEKDPNIGDDNVIQNKYDPANVVQGIMDKVYDVSHTEKKQKKSSISSFERILIIVGIVLFSILILVSGVLIYRNMKGNSVSNNVRNNLRNNVSNNIRNSLGNNVNIAQKNIAKLIKSSKK